MMAANSLMPYMPRLLIEKVPPVNSSGFNFPALACAQQCSPIYHIRRNLYGTLT
jgi:hypothetical protein